MIKPTEGKAFAEVMKEIKNKVAIEEIEIKSVDKMRDGSANIRITGTDTEKKKIFKNR